MIHQSKMAYLSYMGWSSMHIYAYPFYVLTNSLIYSNLNLNKHSCVLVDRPFLGNVPLESIQPD